MTLRVRNSETLRSGDILVGATVPAPVQGDSWASRLAKLIPAEALSLYGAGQAIIPQGRTAGLIVLVGACLVFAGGVRYSATKDAATGEPQWTAIAIAIVSFLLWVGAFRPPNGPFDLGEYNYLAALAALCWATIIPVFYKGDV